MNNLCLCAIMNDYRRPNFTYERLAHFGVIEIRNFSLCVKVDNLNI